MVEQRPVPLMPTDEEAEAFLDQDFADLGFSRFKPLSFEAGRKTARENMRPPETLIGAVKARVAARGLVYRA